ncbi:ABC transporter permease (plasmid) [Haloferax prahovense]|uniref:ABC transporter permease n=1 Tax=Haloferax prahovense TaxID=381852 RepID=UPI003C73BCC1
MRLAQFLAKRSVHGLFVVWGVITTAFLLRFIAPGSAISVVAPIDATPEMKRAIAHELGLNKPLYVQYVEYLGGLLQGDMGYSYISNTEASARILARLPATLELAFAGTIVAIVLSIPLGVVSATRRNTPADYGATLFSLLGISTPNFWLGIMLVLLFAVELNLFPTSRRPIGFDVAMASLLFEMEVNPLLTWLSHITLPAVALGTYFTALITRLTRSEMLDELGKMYINAVRAKGIPEVLVEYRHALRNALIPVITVLGLQLGSVVGGAVITESVFSWPGLGTLIINAVNARDWPIIQGSLVVIGSGFVIVNIVVDALYAHLNPEINNE